MAKKTLQRFRPARKTQPQPAIPTPEIATATASEQITLSPEQFKMVEELYNGANELWHGLQDVDCILFLCHEAMDPEAVETAYPQFEGFRISDGVRQALRLMFKELRRLDEGFDQVRLSGIGDFKDQLTRLASQNIESAKAN